MMMGDNNGVLCMYVGRIGGKVGTHHIPLLLLLIKQFTRLPHSHTDKRILSALLMLLLALIAAAAAA